MLFQNTYGKIDEKELKANNKGAPLMKNEQILKYVAPCSLLCYTCLAFKDGAFSECAPRLSAYSEGVCEFLAQTYGSQMSEEEREKHHSFFNEFHNALRQLSGGFCQGCRNDSSDKRGCIEGCVIPACVKDHEVDFCAQCDEFPCQRVKDFFITQGEKFIRVWENGSRQIQEVGIDAYFEQKKNASHYLHYKEKAE